MTLAEKLANLTKDNGAVKDLRDLLVMTVFNTPELEQFFTVKNKVHNGDKLGWLGDMQDIGWAGANCAPEYVNPTYKVAEKTWAIGDWSAPLYWCYKEFESTIAEYALKEGTEIGDLTATQIMNIVIKPALERSLTKAYWRMVWFGDTAAKNVTDSGVITNGISVNLFKTCDGLWKQLFAVGSGNSAQHTTIAANSQNTTALQKSTLLTAGVATGIVDDILLNADSRIAGQQGAAIFMTKSLADALSHDIKDKYKVNMPWETIFNGVRLSEYDGIPVISMDVWDRMILEYQSTGTKLNLPHRAFFGSPTNLLVGTPASSLMSDFDLWFDKHSRKTEMYATGKIGTLTGEDTLFHIAY